MPIVILYVIMIDVQVIQHQVMMVHILDVDDGHEMHDVNVKQRHRIQNVILMFEGNRHRKIVNMMNLFDELKILGLVIYSINSRGSNQKILDFFGIEFNLSSVVWKS